MLEHSGGLKVPRYGKIAVAVDAERGFAEVIGSLMHELGHMRQALINPDQGGGSPTSLAPDGLKEAQAQQFERAFWLEMEGFTGLELLSYPDHRGLRDLIEFGFDTWFAEPDQTAHSYGFVIQWLSLLDDPNLTHLQGGADLAGTPGTRRIAGAVRLPGGDARRVRGGIRAGQEAVDTAARRDHQGSGRGQACGGPPPGP